ncbi:MAG: hypothetical protein JHD02_02990 [Thermoleophilaceae bacterium]|nr:hypothetical protein [Thermoleophilaceae bacterium]
MDLALPIEGGDDSHRRRLIDGAFRLADQTAAAQLSVMRSALHRRRLSYGGLGFDAVVKAFNDVNVNVNVSVPTDVGAFKWRSSVPTPSPTSKGD